MSHELMNDGKHMIYDNREVPWHRLGTAFASDAGLTVVQGVELAKSDYKVHKVPTVSVLPYSVDADGEIVDGETIVANDRHVLWRAPFVGDGAWREIGSCGPDYTVMDNMAIAELLDGLKITDHFPLDTHGVLGKGEKAFWSFRAGVFGVKGEEVRTNLNLLDDKSGGAALVAKVCNERVVCRNTWESASGMAGHVNFAIRHDADALKEAGLVFKILTDLDSALKEAEAECNRLAEIKITDEALKKILNKVYPAPSRSSRIQLAAHVAAKKELTEDYRDAFGTEAKEDEARWEAAKNLMATHRASVRDNYKRLGDSDTMVPEVKGTGWHLFNAITEYADHLSPRAHTVGAARSQFDGPVAQLKVNAYKEILKVGR